MRDWQSQSHVRWYCKYHIVFVPKYRRRVIYGQLRRRIGRIIRELCQQQGVELVEGHAMPDHVHLCLSIPPTLIGSRALAAYGDVDGPSAANNRPWSRK